MVVRSGQSVDAPAAGASQALGRPVESRRLYQQVADRIRALIRNGEYPPLTRLPAERDLAQQLAISRPSLREALIALEIDGSVEIRMGSGIYVCDPSDKATMPTRAMGESPLELMQARLAVEGSVVVLACARMTPEALRALNDTIGGMRAAIEEGRDPVDHDRRFHVAIAHQAGNTVLARIVASLFDERHSQISTRISSRYENTESWTAALSEHRVIHAALEAADPLGAQAAMGRHMQLSAARWSDREVPADAASR